MKRFNEDGVMTFRFDYSSSSWSASTLDIGGKQFNKLQDRPLESLEKLGFGEIEYIDKNIRVDFKNTGYFTITKELLDYSSFIHKSKIHKKYDRIIEGIKCNEIPISIGISILAVIISIISFLLK
jgi:hypothetical protein